MKFIFTRGKPRRLFAVALALAIVAPICFGFGVSKAEAAYTDIDGVDWSGADVEDIYVETLADLQTAIATARANGKTTPTAIILNRNINLTGKAISIPQGARVKLSSGEGGPYTIDAKNLSRVIEMGWPNNTLMLENIKITGGNPGGPSGGSGGGVYVGNEVGDSKLILNAGTIITGNKAYVGGGVHISCGTFNMNGGEISNNDAINKGNGGGVYFASGASGVRFTMNGGRIINNTAAGNGGGVHIDLPRHSFTLKGGEISKNSAVGNGGGIYMGDYSKLDIPAGASVSFSLNTASKPYRLKDNTTPRNFAGSVTSISVPYVNILNGFNTDTADDILSANKKSVFNNYDINYTLGAVAVEDEVSYTVNYDLSGGFYKKSSEIHTKGDVKWHDSYLLPDGREYAPELMSKEGYTFAGWSVSFGGKTGVTNTDKYSDLAKDKLTASITLTAQWTPIPPPAAPVTPVKPATPVKPTTPTVPSTPGMPTVPKVPNTDNTDNAGDKDNTNSKVDTEDKDTEDDEKPAGGADRNIPPRPASGGSMMSLPGVENAYVEIGEDGTPLGEWRYNDDIGEWIFDEYPPLALLNASANLPRTGAVIPNAAGPGPTPYAMLLMGFASLCAGVFGLRYRQG